MKYVLPAITLLLGGTAGYFIGRSGSGHESRPGPGIRIVPRQESGSSGRKSSVTEPVVAAKGETHVSAINTDGLTEMMVSLSKLDPQTYAETLFAMDNSPDTGVRYLHDIARDMGATSAQAEAYIRLYKERRGMGPEDNVQNLRTFMTLVGGREGIKGLRTFLEKYPDGFNGLDSLVHGVALAQPQETVDWYNTLPDESKMRNRALIGMMWGIAHNGTNAALKVFTDLNATDQAASIHPLADSYSMAKGFAGADELLATIPAAFRDTAINSMLPHLASKPAEDFMNWSAKYYEENPRIGAGFQSMAAKFAAQSPEMAAQWALRNAADKATAGAAGIMMETLLPSRPDLVREWLGQNANHPAAGALRGSLPP